MFQIPNRPLHRTFAYLSEAHGPLKEDWWHRRYRPAKLPGLTNWLTLPHRRDLYSKQIDPDWRSSWDEWVLLSYQGSLGCQVHFTNDLSNRWCMRTLIPVQTRLFAMRVGPEPVQIMVTSVDGKSELRAPEFHHPQSTFPFLSQWMDIFVLCHNNGQEVTFI